MDLKELNSEKIKEIMDKTVEEKMSTITEEWAYMVQASFKQNAAVAATAGGGTNDMIDIIYDSKHAHITRTELMSKLFNSCDFVVEKHATGTNQYNVTCEIVCKDPKFNMDDPYVNDIIGQWMSNTKTFMNYFYK